MRESIGNLCFVIVTLGACAGCSEARGEDPDAGTVTARDASADGGESPSDAGLVRDAGSVSATDAALDAGGTSALVVNELAAVGDDWFELYNAGGAAIDLSGYRIADRAADGTPRLDMAITLTPGTVLGPDQYLLVVADVGAMAMPGPQTTCLASGGPWACFQAPWGLSRDGDAVTVFDAAMSVVASAELTAGAITDGQTWGRLPNGVGAFGVTVPTPGLPNAAP